MSRSRTGKPNTPGDNVHADPRVPFPHSPTPTACRAEPARFAYEHGDTSEDTDGRIDKAKAACRRCPIAEACLKWALANPELTPTGIWAGTVPRQRINLRRSLTERLGEDWVGVVAESDRRRAERRQAARINPPNIRDGALARLELELIPVRPAPYEPWREPMTPARQARNRQVLLAALREAA
ncbi:WhiB family transcriptional regulator [Streptomyces sp. NPDC057426]|uniref:WhiB family transcriptional regulator n=1 Tax=Streptomyces sp. NPDC057426 TaxID=3346128 RepID=UPI0036A666A8